MEPPIVRFKHGVKWTLSASSTNGAWGFDMEELKSIPEVEAMLQSNWEAESAVIPVRQFNSIELLLVEADWLWECRWLVSTTYC